MSITLKPDVRVTCRNSKNSMHVHLRVKNNANMNDKSPLALSRFEKWPLKIHLERYIMEYQTT